MVLTHAGSSERERSEPRAAGAAAATAHGDSRPSIDFREISKAYATDDGPVEAVSGISTKVEHGEFVTLLGPSGCGKTTLLMMAAGIIGPTGGGVWVGGEPVRAPLTEVGIVFQDATLLPWRTVLDNVMLQAEIRRLPKDEFRERAIHLLELTGLGGFEGKYPHELSGGMKQRVSIVRALIHDPPLLLMDEPFGALDAITREQMNVDLQAMCASGSQTVLFVTHSVSEAIFLSDRVLVMSPRPATIDKEISVDFPRPRRLDEREAPEFGRLISEVREVFLSRGVLRQ